MTGNPQDSVRNLVAYYASVGRRQRHDRSIAIIAVAIGIPLAVLIGALLWQFGGDRMSRQPGVFTEQAEDIRTIKASLATEIEAINARRSEFEEGREMLLEQRTLLEQEIGRAREQRMALEAQLQDYASQRQRLADTINEIDGRRRQVQLQKDDLSRERPILEQERAAMIEERQRFEQQRERYAEASALLEKEIQAINAQRAELAAQRIRVEERRKELQSLLDKADSLGEPTTRTTPDSTQRGDPAAQAAPLPEAAPETVSYAAPSADAIARGLPILEEDQLDEMRGGFSVGEDMTISVGITRSASVNGVEQFSNTINIADFMSGITTGALDSVTSTVIQNGTGNFISPDVLATLYPNFATIIQNSLDDQRISTTDVYDISVNNVSSVIEGISESQAVGDTLSLGN